MLNASTSIAESQGLGQAPLHLIGFSFGGILALEIARQWSERGHQAGLLSLLDTSVGHLAPNPAQRWWRWLLTRVSEMAAVLQTVIAQLVQRQLVYGG